MHKSIEPTVFKTNKAILQGCLLYIIQNTNVTRGRVMAVVGKLRNAGSGLLLQKVYKD